MGVLTLKIAAVPGSDGEVIPPDPDPSGALPAARSGSTAYVAGEGDSISQATPYHSSSCSYHRFTADKLGKSYWSSGVGGTQTNTIKARVTSNVLTKNPNIVIVEGGVNDVFYRGLLESEVADDAATIQNLKDIITNCVDGGVLLVVYCPITPWTNGNGTQMASVDTINSTMIAWCASTYPDEVIVADLRPILGQFRSGGASGNFWDIQPQYRTGGEDTLGVHFNQHAYQVWGRYMADLIFDYYEVVQPDAPTSMVIDDTANTIDWTYPSGISSPSALEFSIDEEVTWTTCTAKPQPIGDKFRFTGKVALRTKGTDRPSDSIYNSTPFYGSQTLLPFPTVTGITITSGVLIPSGSGWGNTGLSNKKLAAGTSGRVMCQFSEYTSSNFVLGFKTSNTEGGFASINAGFRFYEDGLVAYCVNDSGTLIPEPGWVNLGDWVCVYRTGSTLKIQKSSDDGATWEDMYTFTGFSSSADLYVGVDEYGTFGRAFYIQGENLV